MPDNHSLKDKRQIVKSLLSRARNDFSVTAAEVGDTARWQVAELGFAYVSESSSHVHEVLAKVDQFIVMTRPDLTILESQIEEMAMEGA